MLACKQTTRNILLRKCNFIVPNSLEGPQEYIRVNFIRFQDKLSAFFSSQVTPVICSPKTVWIVARVEANPPGHMVS